MLRRPLINLRRPLQNLWRPLKIEEASYNCEEASYNVDEASCNLIECPLVTFDYVLYDKIHTHIDTCLCAARYLCSRPHHLVCRPFSLDSIQAN